MSCRASSDKIGQMFEGTVRLVNPGKKLLETSGGHKGGPDPGTQDQSSLGSQQAEPLTYAAYDCSEFCLCYLGHDTSGLRGCPLSAVKSNVRQNPLYRCLDITFSAMLVAFLVVVVVLRWSRPNAFS